METLTIRRSRLEVDGSLGPIYTVRFLSHTTSSRQAYDMTYDCRSVLKRVLKCYDIFSDVHYNRKGRFTRYDFVACDNGLRQAHDMIYDCCVRQKKCRSILKHVLKRCDNRKSCRRPVVSLSHATKSYRVNRPKNMF